MLHRVVLERVVDLHHVDLCSIDDIDLMCLALDAWQDAERRASKGK